MNEPSELNLWTRQWRAERIEQARDDLRRHSLAFDGLRGKTTDYALSIKMARDVCAQVLELWEASPVDLPATPAPAQHCNECETQTICTDFPAQRECGGDAPGEGQQ